MKKTIIKTVLLLGFLLPALVFGQMYLASETLTTSDRAMLESGLKFNSAPQDSFEFEYEKSPGKAFLLSALVPGAGEYYAGAKWRALTFAGVEVFSWIMYFNRKGKGEDLEKEYKKYADENWTLKNLYMNGMNSEKTGLSGSHYIYLEYDDVEYEGNATYLDTAFVGWESYVLNGDMQPVRTRDYYENIGKYDQFAGGWNDFLNFNSDPDTVYMSDLRNNYLNQRKDSNDALKMATNFATAIMFNHIISAFHAQVAAKNYSPEAEKVSWQVGLITDIRQKNPFRGVSLSVAF